MDLLRSLPIGLYLEQPVTWLHRIDARVKLIWLLGFMLTPIAASPHWRLAIVGGLLLLTLSTRLPFRIYLPLLCLLRMESQFPASLGSLWMNLPGFSLQSPHPD
jgi:energy-coupling factor transporter transmembrane protein EcfT